MKPAPFKYHNPTSTAEAVKLLSDYGYDAKILAGGQSLIPTMNFRLAQPAVLIDLNNVDELNYIKATSNGSLRIGAMTRHTQVENSPLIAERAPLLIEAMKHVAHPQIRTRGTLGGSIAHADPAAEMPTVCMALNAKFKLQNASKERWVSAEDFFISLFTTQLEPEDLLVEIEIPAMPANNGWAFQEVARRKGDFALVGVAALISLDKKSVCNSARISFISVTDGTTLAINAANALIGEKPTPEIIEKAAAIAAEKDIAPGDDIHATAEYRTHLAKVLAQRTLTQAFERAGAK